jgi:hypothetical protein
MKLLRTFTLSLLLIAGLTVAFLPSPVEAQEPGWLEVWLLRDEASGNPLVEYRQAAGNTTGNTVLSFQLITEALNWPKQAGGRLIGTDLENIAVFDPYQGVVNHFPAAGFMASTDELFFNLTTAVLSPNGQAYAYGTVMQHSDWEQPATSTVYVATPGLGDDRAVLQEQTESFLAIAAFGWAKNGQTLLLEDLPQGIGGYILFWTNQNVRALDIATGATESLGNLDGYSSDLSRLALLTRTEAGVTGIQVNDRQSGVVQTYPLPAIGEPALDGGNAIFSPSGARVAYQVARIDPENEKYWTIVVDLATWQSRVVLEDQAQGYELRYGDAAGWLDDNTLVVGSRWLNRSAIVDVTSGSLLREVPGTFLGYAEGISSTAGFSLSAMAPALCPGGAPLSRLAAGMRGRVTFTDGSMTNVRAWADVDAEKAGTVPEGALFTVQSGPICADGYAWWNLAFDDGLVGFVAEGTQTSYFLEPWQ